MSDSSSPNPTASSNPTTNETPKRSRFGVIVKAGLALVFLAVLALGASSYYLSFPFGWPTGIWPAQKNALEQRVVELERAIESEVLGDAMDRRIEQSIDSSLEQFASTQAQAEKVWQSQFEDKLEALAGEVDQLNAAIAQVSATVSVVEDANRTQGTRLDELGEQVATFGRAIEDLRSKVNQAVSGMGDSNGSVTEESVRVVMAQRAQLMEAYWALLEIEGHVNSRSKDWALAGYEALGREWAQSNNDDLLALLPRLEQEQASLAEWSPTDWAQWQTSIQGWLVDHKSWSFAQVNPATIEEPKAEVSSAEAGEGWLARLGQLLSGVVRVRPRDVAALSARDQRLARANIEQRLLLLQIAVTSHDAVATRGQSAQLGLEIERLYNADQTRAVRDQLERLASIENSPPPDSLGVTKRALEQVLYQP